MQPLNIYRKFFRIALITSPFFGLFGATPGFATHEFEWERTLRFFLFISSLTFYLWLINILLISWLGDGINQKLQRILRYVVSAVICIVSVYFISKLLPMRMPKIHRLPMPFDKPHEFSPMRMIIMPVVQGLSINIIVIILLELIMLKETKIKVDSENEELKLANLEAKNNQLKQQLHPHFLFNSLSTLRSLISRSPEKAEAYLERLSDLLRFSTNNSSQSLVLLKEEVQLCTNYLNMQQTRFGDALHFRIDIPEAIQENSKVPVFALQQLAENAIKHNVLTKQQPLYINIALAENTEWINIINNLQLKPVMDDGGGVGLANLSERYRLAGYDDIIIKRDDKVFSVSVKILTNAGNNN